VTGSDFEPLAPGARLSPHLSWAEATTTSHREFLAEQANPPPLARANLRRLALDVFEPARALAGALYVTSGYRCEGLNRAVGGSGSRPGEKPSGHISGRALDLVPLEEDLLDAYRRIGESAVPFEKIIWEFGRWLHLQAPRHGEEPRRAWLMIFEPGQYLAFDPHEPRLRVG
jgi:hypothetical protein